MKHISIRVPWHDNKWAGTVCKSPSNNPFCLMLKNIAAKRNAVAEDKIAGKLWCELPPDGLPACKGENGCFMSPKGYKRTSNHVYAEKNIIITRTEN